MSTGDERLDAVEGRIDEAKGAADRFEDNERRGLGAVTAEPAVLSRAQARRRRRG
ncbi:hypothetical protein [Nocardioides zhouii]|uniref:hypothetical protein n=1 Tax=Nocardioides zhouii TaxID=1168729 RepID=UPI0013EBB7D1|nr:hypothetical protein [Nocardioides zhouii]